MRFRIALLLLTVPVFASAQTPDGAATKLAALKYVAALQDPATGAFRPTPNAPLSLRATSSAARATKYLGGTLAHKDKAAAFALKCYDPATGGFADAPGGKPDVTLTAVGVMAAVELGVPKPKFAKAMGYLKANATTFEDVRLAAAAVEAWSVKDCPFDLAAWVRVAATSWQPPAPNAPAADVARAAGSLAAFYLRLGQPLPERGDFSKALTEGQRADGGWGEAGAKASDAGSTYRVMRALMLLKQPPADPAAVRTFLASCHNADGGFGTKAGEPSSVGGTYYYAIVTKWLDDMAK